MKTAALIYIAVILLVLYGWVCNLIAVVHVLTANDPLTPARGGPDDRHPGVHPRRYLGVLLT
jgi:hypothetical protein